MRTNRMIAAVMVTLAWLASPSAAEVPSLINYQGRMLDHNGNLVSSNVNINVAIYTAETLGDVVYTENVGTVPVNNGVYSLMFGANKIQLVNAFANPESWLEVSVNGIKVSPRQRLVSVPYAVIADTVPDGSLTGEKLARESVWPEHEGRNNTVVSYFAAYNYVGNTNDMSSIQTPTNKDTIITDVVFGGTVGGDMRASLRIWYEDNGTNTVLFKQHHGIAGSFDHVSFRSGLMIPAGVTLKFGGFIGGFNSQSATLGGYEITVE